MTGKFSDPDPERCIHYAGFMSHLNLAQANLIFWFLFVAVLLLLCTSSLQHHKSIGLSDIEKNLPTAEVSSPKYRRRIRRLRLHYLSIVSLCMFLSATCTALEVFAAFNIQYCDGEDLMQLYWGFWSVLQVGSNIAIFGVMLQLWIALGNVKTPSWAVALGTPVLVFAALGWILREVTKPLLKRLFKKQETEDEEDEHWGIELWMSRAPTIAVPDSIKSDPGETGQRRNSSTLMKTPTW